MNANGLSLVAGYTFSIVRNPWDWHVSWFHFLRDDTGGRQSGHFIEAELFKTFTFADYINWLEDERSPKSPQGYIIRQVSDWIVGEDGHIAVNRVLRQERLAADLAAMIDDLGLATTAPAGRANESARGDYRAYYSDRDAERIGRRHARDIEMLGYAF